MIYYTSFVFIPLFIVANLRLKENDYTLIFWASLLGCALVAVLTIIFYHDYLGESGRISQLVKGGDSSDYISPLVLSYVSAIGLALGTFFLADNKIKGKLKLTVVIAIIVSVIPFYLGASRGSLVALLLPIMGYIFIRKFGREKIYNLIWLILLMTLLYFASAYLGDTIWKRVGAIGSDIDSNNASAIRLLMWKYDLSTYADTPIFGNSLQSSYVNFYPHNIIIESLLATGLLGTIPLVVFLSAVFIRSFLIIRYHPANTWVNILFYIGFIQNMFSGSIASASFLALGSALIIGYPLGRNGSCERVKFG